MNELNIRSISIIYLSPTKTAQRILEAIAQGIQGETINHLDLTSFIVESHDVPLINDDCTIIGAPVYSGRLTRARIAGGTFI